MSKRTFNTGEPIAYFITWTTYGSWLPGDGRGWNKKNSGEIQSPNRLFVEIAEADLKEDVYLLSLDDRKVVEQTVASHCEIRSWMLHKVNARSNHVHVVVSAPGYKPDLVCSQFKSWCSRNLKKSYPNRERFWTEGASSRWINHQDDLEAAITYVAEAQDKKHV